MCSVLRVSEADLNSIETVKTMRPLFDNYQLDSAKAEAANKNSAAEQDKFLDAVLNTKVMQILMDFFKKKRTQIQYTVYYTLFTCISFECVFFLLNFRCERYQRQGFSSGSKTKSEKSTKNALVH